MKELDEKIRDENMVVLCAGNKIDLTNRKVSEEQASSFAKLNESQAFSVSAMTGDGVNDLFKTLAEKIHKNRTKKPAGGGGEKLTGDN
mmetsp:Transcript_24710/g.34691  ORF Transcript_24710/g.34691 Transcript_24710/m.34691 type:complete len:88 (-) Transcript_24710:8-271(-)